MVAITYMNSWIVAVYPSAPFKLIFSTRHSFPSLFRLAHTWFFMSNSADVSTKAEDAYPTGAPCPCSQVVFTGVRVPHSCFCYFVCMIIFTLCSLLCNVCFPCLVFVPGLHSFDSLGFLDYFFGKNNTTQF